ncbi:hypothetical protein [Woodsholea maritima]|uniref:hypothetical protein n=1 Tax=Woodsholea maritima TaxID=240237 RepID=UPI0003651687|nr:hypothetical protein [Woodsholea maritima]
MAKLSKAQNRFTDIATRRELDALESQRQTPRLERHLTPGGTLTQRVHQTLHEADQRRMAYLRDRLSRTKDKPARDLALSANKGRAKAQFDRGR